MRRKDREITSRRQIESIIRQSQYCHLALCDGQSPYLIPVSFGYEKGVVYIHTAGEGKKTDIIVRNNRVALAFECNVRLLGDREKACDWSFSYESALGYGQMTEIVDVTEKLLALQVIMEHYSDINREIDNKQLPRTRLWKIRLDKLTGKKYAG